MTGPDARYRPTCSPVTERELPMALPDLDSSVGHSFGLEFDGIRSRRITEVTGLKMEQDVIELKQNGPDGKYMIKKLPGRWKAGEVTLTRAADRRPELREVGQGLAVRQDGRRPQGRRDHRLRLRGQRGQALQADRGLAEEPGDRLAEGRRHQRADREAGRSPTSGSRSSNAPSCRCRGTRGDPERDPSRGRIAPARPRRNRDCAPSSASCCRAAMSTRPARCTATA